MKNLFQIILVVVAAWAVISCSKLTQENFSKIETGMKKGEVEAILGKPSTSKAGSALGITSTTYTYESGGSKVEVVFLNDAVISKNGEFKK